MSWQEYVDRDLRRMMFQLFSDDSDGKKLSLSDVVDMAYYIKEMKAVDDEIMKKHVRDWVHSVKFERGNLTQCTGIMGSGKTEVLAQVLERASSEGWMVITNMVLIGNYENRNVYYCDRVSKLQKLLDSHKNVEKQIVFDDSTSYYRHRSPTSIENQHFNELNVECRKKPNYAQLWYIAHRGKYSDLMAREMLSYKLIRPIMLPKDPPPPPDYRGVVECRTRDNILLWWSTYVRSCDRKWLKFDTDQQSHWYIDGRLRGVRKLIKRLTIDTKKLLLKYNLNPTQDAVKTIFRVKNWPTQYGEEVLARLKWEKIKGEWNGAK